MFKGGLGYLEASDPDRVASEQQLKLFRVQYTLKKKGEGERAKWF